MNSSDITTRKDLLGEAVFKNIIVVLFGVIINCINSLLLYVFYRNPAFLQEPRYILYMHLIINEIISLCMSVSLFVLTYALPGITIAICCILLLTASIVCKITPLNLAGMAVECFVAVCYPLHHARICTVRHIKCLISVIWLLGALPGLVDLFLILSLRRFNYFTSSRLCYPQNVFTSEYSVVSDAGINIVYMCSVWMLLFYTYFKVLFSAKAAASESGQAQKARRTILLHGVQLSFCTVSLVAPAMDSALISLFPNYRSLIMFCNYIVTSILPRLLSPLIYGMRDQKFKKYMKSLLMCSFVKKVIDPSTN